MHEFFNRITLQNNKNTLMFLIACTLQEEKCSTQQNRTELTQCMHSRRKREIKIELEKRRRSIREVERNE